MDGKEIAVWVYSNLDNVGFISEWQSLGAKDVKKDSHLARMVRYAPGAIEARGFRGGQVVMTARRPIAGSGGAMGLLASFVGNGAMVFTLRQDGNKLRGSMEGADGGFFGGSDPGRNLQRILAQFPVQVNMAERLTYMG
jgi:hypothetical protein